MQDAPSVFLPYGFQVGADALMQDLNPDALLFALPRFSQWDVRGEDTALRICYARVLE